MSVYPIALSGLVAQSRAVGAYAQNIANVHSNGRVNAQPGERSAYIPVDPVFISENSGGVREENRVVDPSSVDVYLPDSADANEEGLVSVPNIDLESQITGLLFSKNAYIANAKVIGVQRDMDKELLDIFA